MSFVPWIAFSTYLSGLNHFPLFSLAMRVLHLQALIFPKNHRISLSHKFCVTTKTGGEICLRIKKRRGILSEILLLLLL
jgi:hypothetical protein